MKEKGEKNPLPLSDYRITKHINTSQKCFAVMLKSNCKLNYFIKKQKDLVVHWVTQQIRPQANSQSGSKGVAHTPNILHILHALLCYCDYSKTLHNLLFHLWRTTRWSWTGGGTHTTNRTFSPWSLKGLVSSDESLPLPVRSAWNTDCAKTSRSPEKVQNKLFPVDGFAGNSNPPKQNGWTTAGK